MKSNFETVFRIYIDDESGEPFADYKLDIDLAQFGDVMPSVGDYIISPSKQGEVWEIIHRYFRPESNAKELGYAYVVLVVKRRRPKKIEIELDRRLATEYFGE